MYRISSEGVKSQLSTSVRVRLQERQTHSGSLNKQNTSHVGHWFLTAEPMSRDYETGQASH